MKPRMIIIAFMAFLFCSCNDPSPTKDAKRSGAQENTLRYDVNAPFGTLDPTVVNFSGSNNVFPLLYSYLFVPERNGTLQPDLAIQWDFDSESLAWTIVLREDAMFHNGRKITTKDVKYSIESKIENVFPEHEATIDRISCLSDTKLRVHLKRPVPFFLQTIWSIEICPSPEGEDVDFYYHPIGSGPFIFKSRKGEQSIILEANSQYYAGRPSLDRIIFFYQPDREKSWTRLLRGETDIASEIVPKTYDMIKQYKNRFYFDRYIIEYCTLLLYNTVDPLFSDPRVRMALSHAIDRHYIVREILQGYGVVASGSLGVQSPYHNPKVKPVAFDPQKAVALLKSAGWSPDKDGRLVFSDGSPFDFTLLVFRESQIEKTVARYIQLCLDEIGIRMQVKPVPFDDLKRAYYRNTDFQAVMTELQTGELYPHLLLRYWSSSSSGCSFSGCFQDTEVTRMLTDAFQTENPERRRSLLREFDSRLASLQPGTFLFQKMAIDVMSRRFDLPVPFSLSNQGTHALKHASLVADE
ncbi:peptide ABC transporter substrate-binding protein [Desulfosarcina ovata subsp. sediminis]|uniref:Peptide ABC transporter substrate-binding protein n=1 Tax=Desulfosarcina ovata subsp. sediminis TaxID=885957 RepID=A0A5K7ZTR3_9BACT|nr:ABC transporter substrate-binding protein [Desulfosarcina ovata]BBO83607.1 peptide ABC transporter substrate-binding protein [Desulfosarcina ovata subsp. sediminis]